MPISAAMYRVLDGLNEQWREQGIIGPDGPPPVRFRCGIHQGESVVGMVSSEHRADYMSILSN